MQAQRLKCPPGLCEGGPDEYKGEHRNWNVILGVLLYAAGAAAALEWVAKELVGLSFAVPVMFFGLVLMRHFTWTTLTLDLSNRKLRFRSGHFLYVLLFPCHITEVPLFCISAVEVVETRWHETLKYESATPSNKCCNINLIFLPEWSDGSPLLLTTVIGVEDAEIARREWEAFLRQLPEVQQL